MTLRDWARECRKCGKPIDPRAGDCHINFDEQWAEHINCSPGGPTEDEIEGGDF